MVIVLQDHFITRLQHGRYTCMLPGLAAATFRLGRGEEAAGISPQQLPS